MNYEQVAEILTIISNLYANFKIDDDKVNAWLDVLQAYDFEEVKNSLKSAMADDKFQKEPPTPYYLVRNLVKKYDKVDYTKQVVYCPICNRPLNQPNYAKHFDRCSSVEYVIRESKKWLSKNLSKRALFELLQEQFDEKYNWLLKYIMEHTNDETERKRISFIFNPPSEEIARNFLKGN